MDYLNELFSEKAFLIIFWTHFLAVNLFCGSWMVNDSRKIINGTIAGNPGKAFKEVGSEMASSYVPTVAKEVGKLF